MKQILLVALGCALWSSPHLAYSQSCLPVGSLGRLNQAKVGPGADGLTHLTWGFGNSDGSPATSADPNVTAAIEASVAEWNGFSATTKIEFDYAPKGTIQDIQLVASSNTSDTGGCAAYSTITNQLFYSPTFVSSATQKPDNGRLILSHELGHALGLADGGLAPNPPSIMNNPLQTPNACTNPIVGTSHVQPTDASASVGCHAQATAQFHYLERKTNEIQTVEPHFISYNDAKLPQSEAVCTYTFERVDFYVNSGDGPVYNGSQLFLQSVTC